MKLLALIDRYVGYRKSLGEDFGTNARRLKQLYRLIGNIAVSKISSKQITKFLYGKKFTATYFAKYSALKGFYNYCISRGYVKDYPLPTILPKRPPPFIPYVYSHEELKIFFATTLTSGHYKVTPYTTYVFFVLLYGTGLRVREALSLTMSDVNLSQSILIIRNTKFYKTRIVPLNKDLSKLLIEYAKYRKSNKYPQEDRATFFMSKKCRPLLYATMRAIFVRTCKKAGIKRINYRPRIHDFRGTFATHRIISWYETNSNFKNLLPLLSVYMGHKDLSSTATYLSMTPELLYTANQRFEKYATGGVQ
jgi:integrase/recombinase XerD